MKTQYYTATSLDGFIATEDDSLEWLFPLGDVNDTGYPAFIAKVGALAMGATSVAPWRRSWRAIPFDARPVSAGEASRRVSNAAAFVNSSPSDANHSRKP